MAPTGRNAATDAFVRFDFADGGVANLAFERVEGRQALLRLTALHGNPAERAGTDGSARTFHRTQHRRSPPGGFDPDQGVETTSGGTGALCDPDQGGIGIAAQNLEYVAIYLECSIRTRSGARRDRQDRHAFAGLSLSARCRRMDQGANERAH